MRESQQFSCCLLLYLLYVNIEYFIRHGHYYIAMVHDDGMKDILFEMLGATSVKCDDHDNKHIFDLFLILWLKRNALNEIE